MDEERSLFSELGNLESVPDEHTVPDGEYELRLVTFERRPGKDKGPFIFAQFEVVDDPLAKLIQHVMMLPTDGSDERQRLRRLRAIKSFYKAFGIPLTEEFRPSDYIGNTGWALIAEEESGEFGLQNRVRRFVS